MQTLQQVVFLETVSILRRGGPRDARSIARIICGRTLANFDSVRNYVFELRLNGALTIAGGAGVIGDPYLFDLPEVTP